MVGCGEPWDASFVLRIVGDVGSCWLRRHLKSSAVRMRIPIVPFLRYENAIQALDFLPKSHHLHNLPCPFLPDTELGDTDWLKIKYFSE